jgi:hypothetical protein
LPTSSGAARRAALLQAIGGGEARSDMTTNWLADLDERDRQLKQRLA